MKCAVLKLRFEFGFHQFTGSERGVFKYLNELILREVLTQIDKNLGSPGYYSL